MSIEMTEGGTYRADGEPGITLVHSLRLPRMCRDSGPSCVPSSGTYGRRSSSTSSLVGWKRM